MHYLKLTISISLLTLVFSCQENNPTDHQISTLEEKEMSLDPNNYNVAFLIMDGTFNTELTAPYDIYQHTIFRDSIKAMNVFTVANTSSTITTFEGMRIQPDFNYLTDEMPSIDILVIPSAEHHLDTDLDDEKMIDFVKHTAENALYITSHCDGAFVLAKADLLNDVACTTFPADIEAMREMFPHLNVLDNTLFVHDRNVITSAGGAKSFEASLYLCELLYGKKNADEIAEGMVIDWDLSKVPHTVID